MGLFTRKFYDTTKIQKILPQNSAEALLLRPIISKFNTAILELGH